MRNTLRWHRIVQPPHDCPLPSPAEMHERGAWIGSQVECMECRQGWEYTAQPNGAWEKVNVHGW